MNSHKKGKMILRKKAKKAVKAWTRRSKNKGACQRRNMGDARPFSNGVPSSGMLWLSLSLCDVLMGRAPSGWYEGSHLVVQGMPRNHPPCDQVSALCIQCTHLGPWLDVLFDPPPHWKAQKPFGAIWRNIQCTYMTLAGCPIWPPPSPTEGQFGPDMGDIGAVGHRTAVALALLLA